MVKVEEVKAWKYNNKLYATADEAKNAEMNGILTELVLNNLDQGRFCLESFVVALRRDPSFLRSLISFLRDILEESKQASAANSKYIRGE